MKRRDRSATWVILMLVMLFPMFSYADLITGITIQSAEIGTTGPMSPDKAISGVGLSGDTPALSGGHGTHYASHWWGSDTTPQITIDLEGNYSVDTIHIWNFNGTGGPGTTRGAKDVEIYVSPDEDEGNLVKLSTDGSGTHDNAGMFLFPQASGATDYPGFDLDLSGVTNAELLENVRLVRINGLTIHGGDKGGLSEIQFGGSVAAPLAPTVDLDESSVSENVTNGTVVGVLSMGAADDWTPPITYAFNGGEDDGSFGISSIDATTANLLTGRIFDFETKASYTIDVLATDSAATPNTTNGTFEIIILDVAEPAEGMFADAEASPGATLVATLQSLDSGAVTYGVSPAAEYHNALFKIDETNTDELHLKVAPAADAVGEAYFVEVTATGSGWSSTMLIKVTIVAGLPKGTIFKFR